MRRSPKQAGAPSCQGQRVALNREVSRSGIPSPHLVSQNVLAMTKSLPVASLLAASKAHTHTHTHTGDQLQTTQKTTCLFCLAAREFIRTLACLVPLFQVV